MKKLKEHIDESVATFQKESEMLRQETRSSVKQLSKYLEEMHSEMAKYLNKHK